MSRRDPTARWPLVGRDRELAAMTGAWARRDLRGFVICGPAGVGKSRLADELLTLAERRGDATVGRLTATAATATVPLGAIAHLMPAGADLSDPVRGFAQVAAAFGETNRRGSWVLVDDLHLLDSASAVLLRQLLDARLARLIATVRTGEPIADAAAALHSDDSVHRVDLDVLDPGQVDRLLQAALGAPVERGTLVELHTASGGNVLYLRELVLGAVDAEVLVHDGEVWHFVNERPPSTPRLAELIGRRLSGVEPAGQPVLELLALAEPVSLSDALAMAPMEVLVRLETAGLIRLTQDRRRTSLALAHPLYGEVMRESIPLLRRRAVLLEQATRIDAYGLRRRDDLLRLATCQLGATGTADIKLLRQAAVLARHANDYPHVIALLAAIPEELQTRFTWLLKGESHAQLLEFRAAQAAFARVLELTEGEARPAMVMVRAQCLFWGESRVREAFEVNATALESGDALTRAVLTANDACMDVFVGKFESALATLRDGAPTAVPQVRFIGAHFESAALEALGRSAAAIQVSEQAYAENRQVAETVFIQTAAWQLVYLARACCGYGDLNRAQAVAEQAIVEAAEANATLTRVHAALAAGWSHWLAGHPLTARRGFAEAIALSRSQPILGVRLAAAGLAAACALHGDLAAAAAAVQVSEHAAAIAIWEGLVQVGRAWVLAARGQIGPARELLVSAARAERDLGNVSAEAVLLTDVARLGGAAQVVDRLAELAGVCEGPFAPARAGLAAALATEHPERLLASVDELEAVGADLLAAEAAAAAAMVLQRGGQVRAAAAATVRAQALAQRCEGARTPLLASIGPAVALTPREREVALLVASGATSRDVAQALTLSVRTVENHLMRVYAKLGVTGRRELAQALTALPTGDTAPA